jgi:hypothetical protein
MTSCPSRTTSRIGVDREGARFTLAVVAPALVWLRVRCASANPTGAGSGRALAPEGALVVPVVVAGPPVGLGSGVVRGVRDRAIAKLDDGSYGNGLACRNGQWGELELSHRDVLARDLERLADGFFRFGLACRALVVCLDRIIFVVRFVSFFLPLVAIELAVVCLGVVVARARVNCAVFESVGDRNCVAGRARRQAGFERVFIANRLLFVRAFAPRQVGFEVVRADQVFDMEERSPVLADVDEGGLHSG